MWKRASRATAGTGPRGGGADRGSIIGRYVREGAHPVARRLLVTAFVGFSLLYGFSFAIYGPYFLLQYSIPLILLSAVLIWVLPTTNRTPRKLLSGLLVALIFVTLCWPDYIAIAIPGLPWITAIRIVATPLALVMLVSLSVSPDLRAEMKRILGTVPLIWKPLVIFTICGFVTIPLSSNMSNSISKFVIAQLIWTSVFFVSCYVFTRPGLVSRLGVYLWGITVYVCAVGMYEAKYSRLPWAGRIPSFLKVEDENIQRILAGTSRAATGIYRVQSKFTTALGLGEYLGLAVPFLIHMIFTSRNMLLRLVCLLSLPPIFFIILRTDSRLAVICFFMSILLYVLVWGALRWKDSKESLFGPAIVIGYPALFTMFITATLFIGRLHAMVWGSGAQAASTEARKTMYHMGIPMVVRNPIGHGMGQGADTLGFFSPSGILTIDTYYLAVALEYGVIGFLAYYGMIIAAIWYAGKTLIGSNDPEIRYLAPIAIGLMNFLISKSVFSQQDNHPMIFVLLGVTAALVYRSRMQAEPVVGSGWARREVAQI